MKSVQVVRKFCKPMLSSTSVCCITPSNIQVRLSANISFTYFRKHAPQPTNIRRLGLGPTSKDFDESTKPTMMVPLTKVHALELVMRCTADERKFLLHALQKFESNRLKGEFEDTLAGHKWRSSLGRPSKVSSLGDTDPTGTYCPVPDDWLKTKYALTVPRPSSKELLWLAFTNSIPFIGFGFLDNFIMIIAGDSIESSMSAYITLSTMAAAALGNTFSDVISIGSSLYVERGAAALGLSPPPLSPAQLDMRVTRRCANLGRVIGITIGCFLGMTPLLFKDDEKKAKAKDKTETAHAQVAVAAA